MSNFSNTHKHHEQQLSATWFTSFSLLLALIYILMSSIVIFACCLFAENQALLGTFNFLSKSSANRVHISPDRHPGLTAKLSGTDYRNAPF